LKKDSPLRWTGCDQQGADMNWLHQFLTEEDGPTAVEYAVMMALIIVVCLVAIGSVGSNASSLWGSNESNLDIAWQAGN
jgi:pilus assembly protein Flp/PilA